MRASGANIITRRLRHVSVKQAFGLLFLSLKHPSLMYPTIKASIEALNISQKLYGNKHFGHQKENAFRHALWSYLIAAKTENSDWAKYFTTQYENIFQNQPDDRQMDLHNNEVGIQLFREYGSLSESDLLQILQQKTEKAKRFEDHSVLKEDLNHQNLVYF